MSRRFITTLLRDVVAERLRTNTELLDTGAKSSPASAGSCPRKSRRGWRR